MLDTTALTELTVRVARSAANQEQSFGCVYQDRKLLLRRGKQMATLKQLEIASVLLLRKKLDSCFRNMIFEKVTFKISENASFFNLFF